MDFASAVRARLARVRDSPGPGDLLFLLLLHRYAAARGDPGIPDSAEILSRALELMPRHGWNTHWQRELHPNAEEVQMRTGIPVPPGTGEAQVRLTGHVYWWASVACDPTMDERNDASFCRAPDFITDPLTRDVVELLQRADPCGSRMVVLKCVIAAVQGILPHTAAPPRLA